MFVINQIYNDLYNHFLQSFFTLAIYLHYFMKRLYTAKACAFVQRLFTKNSLGQVNYFFGWVHRCKNVISKKKKCWRLTCAFWRRSVGHDSSAGQQRIFLYFFPIKTGGPEARGFQPPHPHPPFCCLRCDAFSTKTLAQKHSWGITDQSVASCTGLTLMPECRCRTYCRQLASGRYTDAD